MIQVINRAFDIIELVSEDTSRSYTLSDIADRLKLNHATCANIIKTMVARKYLEQVAPKKGYKLGFMVYQVAGDRPYEDKLKKAASGIMDRLTRKLNETSLLAILKKEKRLIIHQVDANHDLMVKSSIEKDAYSSATGRLLLAYMTPTILNAFVQSYGLPPKETWKEASTLEGLKEELEQIRNNGYAKQISSSHIVGFAVPIRQNGDVIASMSVYLPVSRLTATVERQALEELDKSTREITIALSK